MIGGVFGFDSVGFSSIETGQSNNFANLFRQQETSQSTYKYYLKLIFVKEGSSVARVPIFVDDLVGLRFSQVRCCRRCPNRLVVRLATEILESYP